MEKSLRKCRCNPQLSACHLLADCSSDSLENHPMQMSKMKPNSIKSLQLLLLLLCLYIVLYRDLITVAQKCSEHQRPPGIATLLHFEAKGGKLKFPKSKFSRPHHPVLLLVCIKYVHMTVKAEQVMSCDKSHLELLHTTILC